MPRGRGEKAILRPERMVGLDVSRHDARDLSPWVEYVWVVRWNLQEPHQQAVIPQPVVHAAVEDGRLLVHGVGQTHFERVLVGRGHVVGLAFRAGGLRAFVDGPVSRWSNRVVTWEEATDRDDRGVARSVLDDAAEEPSAMADRLLAWLQQSDPAHDPVADDVAALVATAESDPTFTRADQLAAHAGVGLRTLQRQFAEYVGIGPKWVVQRFRLLDAAAAAHRGADVDWAALAAELGYSDQAHLTRAFSAVVGSPPAAYARRA